jgi:hypothetical protein
MKQENSTLAPHCSSSRPLSRRYGQSPTAEERKEEKGTTRTKKVRGLQALLPSL